MAALIAAFALAWSPQPVSRPWICARNFNVDGVEGLAVQTIYPDNRVSGINIQVWTAGAVSGRLHWNISPGSRVMRPTRFAWEFEFPPPNDALWTRYWGDGRLLGQELLLSPEYLRRARRQRIWGASTADPQILEGFMTSQLREVEIVDSSGAAIARETVPLPTPAMLRSNIATEIHWLEAVIRTRANPCYEEPIEDVEF